MFFHYSQNNSGGSFDYDAKRGITHHVIIEADNPSEADERAEKIGLYFDGAGDCECCGYRWSNAYGEGDEVPTVYADVLTRDWQPSYRWMRDYEAFVHYRDGRVVGFGPDNQ